MATEIKMPRTYDRYTRQIGEELDKLLASIYNDGYRDGQLGLSNPVAIPRKIDVPITYEVSLIKKAYVKAKSKEEAIEKAKKLHPLEVIDVNLDKWDDAIVNDVLLLEERR